MKTKIIGLAASLSVSVASAAVDTTPVYESRPPSHRSPAENEGVVVVSLTTNAGLIDGPDVLVVDGAGARYKLRSVASAYARNTALFVGVLPNGDYKIHSLEERDSFKTVNVTDKQREILGGFAVRGGELCDLGRLVTTQIGFAYGTGRSATIDGNREQLAQFAPETAQLWPASASSCWHKRRDASDLAEDYARDYPVGAGAVVELSGGRVAVPTAMGSILIRGTEGRWSVVRSDGMERLLWLAGTDEPGSELVAVGELNAILRLGTDRKLHRLPAGNLPLGTLLFVDGNAAVGWHVVQQRGDDLRIYRTDSLDDPRWTEIGATKTGFSAWSGAKNFWVWPTSQGCAYAITDQGTMRFYDYASKTWTERHTPKNDAILAIAHSPGDVIGILTSPGGGLGGVMASDYYSRDQGQTWIPIPSAPYKVKVSAPRVLADDTLLINGGVFGRDSGLHASKDGGATWTKVSDKVGPDDFYWNLSSAGLFNIDKSLGIETISHSIDGGTTWKTEYVSADSELLRLQLDEDRAADEAKKGQKTTSAR